jgi:surface protein
MFYSAANFNQPIGNWDVSYVTNMESMFENATIFNQDIGNWNVSQVTNMIYMCANATKFNQNLCPLYTTLQEKSVFDSILSDSGFAFQDNPNFYQSYIFFSSLANPFLQLQLQGPLLQLTIPLLAKKKKLKTKKGKKVKSPVGLTKKV